MWFALNPNKEKDFTKLSKVFGGSQRHLPYIWEWSKRRKSDILSCFLLGQGTFLLDLKENIHHWKTECVNVCIRNEHISAIIGIVIVWLARKITHNIIKSKIQTVVIVILPHITLWNTDVCGYEYKQTVMLLRLTAQCCPIMVLHYYYRSQYGLWIAFGPCIH